MKTQTQSIITEDAIEYCTIEDIVPIVEQLEKLRPEERVDYFQDDDTFFIFWFYYYPENFECSLAKFHFVWMYYLSCTNLNLLIEGLRGSLKTEMTKIYVIRSILYKRHKYIVWQSFASESSDEAVTNLSRMLVNGSLVLDYGQVYPFSMKKEDFSKSWSTNFDTTNGVKVKAKALLEKLRWSNVYDEDSGTSRPDLLILDDIDTTDSVLNKDIIDKNELKLREETIGAMSKTNARIIFLGNTIRTDGIVRRFAAKVVDDTQNWKYLKQALYDEHGKCVWGEFFTPENIEKIKSIEMDAFDQNYLLIPKLTIGTTVFDPKQVQRIVYPYKTIEWFELYKPPQDKLVIWVDIAEWWEKSDNSVIKARNRNGESVFEFAWQVDEVLLAQKLDFILTQYYEGEEHKKLFYLGTILIENNTGKAFINECKKYKWFQYVLKTRKIDGTLDSDDLVQKYWFHTTQQSKDLIIREFRNALYKDAIDVSYNTMKEIYTFVYDKQNRPNALAPNHDDRIMADMIAYHGVLSEPFVVEYSTKEVDEDEMTPLQRHLHRIKNKYWQQEEEDW